jgi:hypothetical protein
MAKWKREEPEATPSGEGEILLYQTDDGLATDGKTYPEGGERNYAFQHEFHAMGR